MTAPTAAPRSSCSPKVALGFSLIPGMGQVYLGYPRRGFLQFLAVASLVTLLSANILGPIEPLFDLLMIWILVHNCIDAYRRALLLSEALEGFEPLPPREDWEALSRRARIATGLVLVSAGILILLHVRFGVSFNWVLRWWPAGIVILGLGLLVQALKKPGTPEELA
jgi:hypothetical protein